MRPLLLAILLLVALVATQTHASPCNKKSLLECTRDCKFTNSIENPIDCWASKGEIPAEYQDNLISIQYDLNEKEGGKWSFVLKELGTYTFQFKTNQVSFDWEIMSPRGTPHDAVTITLEKDDNPPAHRLVPLGSSLDYEYKWTPSQKITELPLTLKSSATTPFQEHNHGYAVIYFISTTLENWVQTYWEEKGSSCARRLVARMRPGGQPLTEEYEDDSCVSIDT